MNVNIIAAAIKADFDARSKAVHPSVKSLAQNEISLFRHLADALEGGSGGRLRVNEYHGSVGVVSFPPRLPFTRAKPGCEICDIAIVLFSRSARIVRLTFLQAKYERNWDGKSEVQSAFHEANLEQWHLLASRPLIKGKGSLAKKLPKDVLAGALLESVGSFGVFWKKDSGEFDMFYSSANNLSPVLPVAHSPGSNKYISGKLQPKAYRREALEGGTEECIACKAIDTFLEALLKCRIGTPIDVTSDKFGSPSSVQTRIWLKRTLLGFQQAPTPTQMAQRADLLTPLISLLDTGDEGEPGDAIMISPFKHFFVIDADIHTDS